MFLCLKILVILLYKFIKNSLNYILKMCMSLYIKFISTKFRKLFLKLIVLSCLLCAILYTRSSQLVIVFFPPLEVI